MLILILYNKQLTEQKTRCIETNWSSTIKRSWARSGAEAEAFVAEAEAFFASAEKMETVAGVLGAIMGEPAARRRGGGHVRKPLCKRFDGLPLHLRFFLSRNDYHCSFQPLSSQLSIN